MPKYEPGSLIKVAYLSANKPHSSRCCRGLEEARAFARRMVGAYPSVVGRQAVSVDGIGKVEVEGCSLQELFPPRVGDDQGYVPRGGVLTSRDDVPFFGGVYDD